MKKFMVFFEIRDSIMIEANDEEAAKEIFNHMDTERICDEIDGNGILATKVGECNEDGVLLEDLK